MWVWVATALAVFLFLFDFQNLLAWNRRWVLEPCIEGEWDFTVVVPVYGHRRYFADRSHLDWLKAYVLVAIDVSSADCGPSRTNWRRKDGGCSAALLTSLLRRSMQRGEALLVVGLAVVEVAIFEAMIHLDIVGAERAGEMIFTLLLLNFGFV